MNTLLAPPITHHPSHRGLLRRLVPLPIHREIDAIIVPTIRHARVLRDAFRLGRDLGKPVVAISSRRWSRLGEVLDLAVSSGTHVIAVDANHTMALPSFVTTALRNQHRFSDLSLKRNIGLALARMQNWQSILFLDDDIVGLHAEDVRAAAGHLTRFPVVAVENVGFSDNSVVCHALRRVQRSIGVVQESFVGGGAMLVAPWRVESFFPDVYNEDWLFMLGILHEAERGTRIAVSGTMAQLPYDPYADPDRARYEEFGDTLGEGVFALLDDNQPMTSALDYQYWLDFLHDRGSLLQKISAALLNHDLPPAHGTTSAVQSIRAAQGRHKTIRANDCVRYIEAWLEDLVVWRKFQANLPHYASAPDALRALGLPAIEVFTSEPAETHRPQRRDLAPAD